MSNIMSQNNNTIGNVVDLGCSLSRVKSYDVDAHCPTSPRTITKKGIGCGQILSTINNEKVSSMH